MQNKILSVVVVFATISLILLLNIDITGNVVDFSRECYNAQQSDIQWVISLKQEGTITEQEADARLLEIKKRCTGITITKKFYGYAPGTEACRRFEYDYKEQVNMDLNQYFKQKGVCEHYVPELERCARSDSNYCENMKYMLCLSEFKTNCLK